VGHYVTDVLTDAAVQEIEDHGSGNKSQPLFLFLNHLAPHAGNEDNPLQAPADELARFDYIGNETHRIYAAMVSRLDKSVGMVIDALARQEMLQNSIVLFLSDNVDPPMVILPIQLCTRETLRPIRVLCQTRNVL